jgi:hypothetical protein
LNRLQCFGCSSRHWFAPNFGQYYLHLLISIGIIIHNLLGIVKTILEVSNSITAFSS